jgi:phage baseplate assembly protein W
MGFFLPTYPASIWGALKTGLVYMSAHMDTADPVASVALIVAMADSLKNGADAIEANLAFAATLTNYTNLAPVPAFDLTLDDPMTGFLRSRVSAMQTKLFSIQGVLVAPVANVGATLAAGKPVIPLCPYLELLLSFTAETPPAGLTPANFNAQAQEAADAWPTISFAMRTQGVRFTGSNLNAVNQMGLCAQVVADAVANLPLLPITTDMTIAWNALVAIPTITRFASLTSNDPTSLASQNTSVMRYVILATLDQINRLIIAIRQTVNGEIVLDSLRQGESLMDLAARALSNFELWYSIAEVNGLVPPFVSPYPAPGLASPGQQLLMPTTTATVLNGSAPNYLVNYLGVDLFYGPLNADMLAWTGDFHLTSGYRNLSFSLGRRLQTTLGELIFHPEFGSRLPPQIGSVSSANETSLIAAFATSALLTDPRVNKIVSISATAGENYLIAVDATVLPNGIGTQSVTVNQVVGSA